MPAPSSYCLSLRCRACGHEHPLEPVGVCSRCFGPLEPVYDMEALRRELSRESIEAGPPSLWRYAALLPVTPAAEPRLAPGLTPLVEAPRLASALGVGTLYLKLDTANPTHSFKDRVVAVACAKALEHGATTLACSSTGNLANAVAARAAAEGIEAAVLCPGESRAREADRDRRLRRDDLRRRRHLRRLQQALGRALLRARLGVRQRRPSLVLRRGLEDARLRDRRAARLGAARRGRRPDRVRRHVLEGAPGASASCSSSASSKGRRRASTAARPKAARPSRRRSPRTGG